MLWVNKIPKGGRNVKKVALWNEAVMFVKFLFLTLYLLKWGGSKISTNYTEY